jgi:hypothetical protein
MSIGDNERNSACFKLSPSLNPRHRNCQRTRNTDKNENKQTRQKTWG